MDPIALASLRDLARRLRLAGDEYWDIRCVLCHGFDIGWQDREFAYGHTFKGSTFRVSDARDYWELFYYSEHDKPNPVFQKKRLPWDRTKEQNDRERRINCRAESLFKDAIWLARSIGLSKIPGIDGKDTSKLYGGENVWIWLVFHAAWSRPVGTILRADQYIPVHILTRVIHREKDEAAVGFPPGAKKTPADYTAARKAIAERNRALKHKERLYIWDQSACEAEQRAIQLLNDGCYVSKLPMDPFTASAALLDLIASDTTPSLNTPPPPLPPPECWSAPMPKTEMARRITDRKNARARDVHDLLDKHSLKNVFGNKWIVRLDTMEPELRKKLEESE